MRVTSVLAAVLAASVCAACSTDDPVRTTPRAMAAAVIQHMGPHPKRAAPLFPRDRIPSGAYAVEVDYPLPRDDDSRLRLTLTHFSRPARCSDLTTGLDHCAVLHQHGRTVRLRWEDQEPEEDPGLVGATVVHDGVSVDVYLTGPVVDGDPRQGDLAATTRHLVALAADPNVGFTTSSEYVVAGKRIGAEVWRDWYGQGDGYSAPAELHSYYD